MLLDKNSASMQHSASSLSNIYVEIWDETVESSSALLSTSNITSRLTLSVSSTFVVPTSGGESFLRVLLTVNSCVYVWQMLHNWGNAG
jgi:hypothetical protein